MKFDSRCAVATDHNIFYTDRNSWYPARQETWRSEICNFYIYLYFTI